MGNNAVLKKMIIIKGTMKLLSGLRIGGYTGAIQIGGIDNPVIRDALTNEPYIPGSSIKGKMRYLFELATGKIDPEGNVHSCLEADCMVCLLFGRPAKKEEEEKEVQQGISIGRLIVRDAFLTESSRENLRKMSLKTGWNNTEIKMENSINRKTITANPRTMERVPAGTDFDVEFTLRVFSGDNEEKLLSSVKECLKMIEQDYLGGSGTRGYGRVKFNLKKIVNGNEENFYPEQ